MSFLDFTAKLVHASKKNTTEGALKFTNRSNTICNTANVFRFALASPGPLGGVATPLLPGFVLVYTHTHTHTSLLFA